MLAFLFLCTTTVVQGDVSNVASGTSATRGWTLLAISTVGSHSNGGETLATGGGEGGLRYAVSERSWAEFRVGEALAGKDLAAVGHVEICAGWVFAAASAFAPSVFFGLEHLHEQAHARAFNHPFATIFAVDPKITHRTGVMAGLATTLHPMPERSDWLARLVLLSRLGAALTFGSSSQPVRIQVGLGLGLEI